MMNRIRGLGIIVVSMLSWAATAVADCQYPFQPYTYSGRQICAVPREDGESCSGNTQKGQINGQKLCVLIGAQPGDNAVCDELSSRYSQYIGQTGASITTALQD